MDELINKHVAIDIGHKIVEQLTESSLSWDEWKMWVNEQFENLPTVHPEPCEDAVSREAVLAILNSIPYTAFPDFINAVNVLPPVTPKQTEVIHCADCESYQANFHWCKLHDGKFSLTDYCSYAEQK